MAVIPAPYEGPEKKLEVLLRTPRKTLRSNSDGRWQRVTRASRATIVSSLSNASMDAYLLSESSLFVWEDRVLMITCGRTTPLDAVPEIVAIVGKENVAMVFYERKNFLFPENQPSDFEVDAGVMETHFSGRSYRFGPANGDHVHVFFCIPTRPASGKGCHLSDTDERFAVPSDPAIRKRQRQHRCPHIPGGASGTISRDGLR